jgi:hypothetical protein
MTTTASASASLSLPCSPRTASFPSRPPPSSPLSPSAPSTAAAYADVARPSWYFFYGPSAHPRRLQSLLRLSSLPTLVPARVRGLRLRLVPAAALPPPPSPARTAKPRRSGGRGAAAAACACPPRPVAVRVSAGGGEAVACDGFAWYVPRIEMAEALRRQGAREGLVEEQVRVEFDEGVSGVGKVAGKVFVWGGDARDLPAEEDDDDDDDEDGQEEISGVELVPAVEGMD